MAPLAGESPVTHVVSVVGGIDDDRVLRQSGFLQCFQKTTNGIVDSRNHAQVGPHVDLIFFLGVPAPEISFPIDGGFEELGQGIKNLRIDPRSNRFRGADCHRPVACKTGSG